MSLRSILDWPLTIFVRFPPLNVQFAGDGFLPKPIARARKFLLNLPMSDTSINAFFSVFIFVESWWKMFQTLRIVVECGSVACVQICLLCLHRNAGINFLCDTCCLTRGSFQFCFVAPCKECKNFEKNKFQTGESCLFPPWTEWFQTFDSFLKFAFTVFMLPLTKSHVMQLPRFVHVNRVRWSDLDSRQTT